MNTQQNLQKQRIQQDANRYLSIMIQCITQNKKAPKIQTNNIDLPNLYGQATSLLSQFDQSINRCKKYNQAKINRKYQIIIKDLQAQIRKLNQKLKLEQQARSPTKKHISDILDKLVSYKDQNQILRKELQESQTKILSLQQKIQTQGNALQKIQNQQPKTNIERLPALNGSVNLLQSVKIFLKDKQKFKSINNLPTSNLQKYLKAHQSKMWNWSIGNLLQQLDKWGEGIKQKGEVDMWRIRSGIARKFSNYMDNSYTLIAPTRSSQIDKSGYSSIAPYELRQKKRFSDLQYKRSNKSIGSSIS